MQILKQGKVLALSKLKVGQAAIVLRIEGSGELRYRLLEMGIIKGTKLKFERVAPLGDPLVISVQGFRLSLRKIEASLIIVQRK